MDKVYFSKNKAKIVFAVKVGSETKNISFSNFGGSYSTFDEDVQKAIEDTFYFRTGLIYCSKNQKLNTNQNNKSGIIPKEYPDVTDLNDAVAVLRGEPYKVHHARLKNKEAILSVAKDVGASFPNLSIE